MIRARDLPPPNLQSLEKRIYNLAAGRNIPVARLQRVVANTVVGQMLPSGVVKGGTALKLRFGEGQTRFTPDFDVSRPGEKAVDQYVEELADRLAEGWGGFTGTVRRLEPANVPDVPTDYIMQPYAIALAYSDSHWLTVTFELGRDEVGSTDKPDVLMPADVVEIFAELKLPTPEPIPVLPLAHQVAQKLHACTSVSPKTGRNDRAHDLVDLQLIADDDALDYPAIRAVAERLFTSRRAHAWPPTVVAYPGWDTLYLAAAEGLEVLPAVDDAVEWANDLVKRIATS